MSETEYIVSEIATIVAPLPPRAALTALNEAISRILVSLEAVQAIDVPEKPRRLLQKRGSRSRVDKDPEVKSFIMGLSEPTTIAALRNVLVSRFGEQRTPSKSALHRYVVKLEGRS